MSEDVTEPWASEADVSMLTDVDLTATRDTNTKVSDPSHELHCMVETLRREQDLDTWSATADRALRVEVANAIDEGRVSFSREDYDVAYLIPPAGWLLEQSFPSVEVLDEDVVQEDVGIGGRFLSFNTSSVVHGMVKEAVDDGAYDTMTEMVRRGVGRMLGHR